MCAPIKIEELKCNSIWEENPYAQPPIMQNNIYKMHRQILGFVKAQRFTMLLVVSFDQKYKKKRYEVLGIIID